MRDDLPDLLEENSLSLAEVDDTLSSDPAKKELL
jgi:hypothetical protein